MLKLNYLLLIFINGALLFSTEQNDEERFYHYYYDSSNNREILKTFPVELPRNTDVKIVLDSLLTYLSKNYFHDFSNYILDTRIKLRLEKIDSIKTINRIYKIATVNIIDTNKVCIGAFFQGSTGGHMTQIMLSTNILQPQFAYKTTFLDGVIILYNGFPIADLDHIDIDGVIVPKTYYMNAMEAINKSN